MIKTCTKNPLLVVCHSKMHWIHHGEQPCVLIQTKGDENYLALKAIEAKCKDEEELVLEFIDSCLTSIYQFPDIAVNRLPKKMIRKEFYNHVAELLSTSKTISKYESRG